MVPSTLRSFMTARPPAACGSALTPRWTRVSTPADSNALISAGLSSAAWIGSTLSGRPSGRRLVVALAESDRVARVLAVDNEPLPEGLPDKVEPIQAALDSPALIKALESAGVDTLVHLGVSAEPQAAGGRE